MKKGTNILEAKLLLEKNDVVAIPTETVYGLAANIFCKSAVEKIYKLKDRPLNNPLIVHLKSILELGQYASEIPDKALVLAEAFWPGPLTLVLKKTAVVPHYISSGSDFVALRVPQQPMLLELLDLLSFPLAAPSANPSNRTSATRADHVISYFEDSDLPYVLDGGICKKGLESTIVGFENGEPIIYRLGALSIEAIEDTIGNVICKENRLKEEIITPGMFSKHYATQTPLRILSDFKEVNELKKENVAFLYYGDLSFIDNQSLAIFNISLDGNLEEAASNLFATLLEIDQKKFNQIITLPFPNMGLGMTINDRLIRASKN